MGEIGTELKPQLQFIVAPEPPRRLNIAVSHYFYPVSVGKFFRRAFKRLGHNVIGIGPFSPTLPWTQKDVSKWIDRPDVELTWQQQHHIGEALDRCPVKPDLLVQVDAGYRLVGKAPDGMVNVVIATDAHCFPETYYMESFRDADFQYMMHDHYAKPLRDVGYPVRWLPYAFDPEVHYWNPSAPKHHVVTMLTGLMYGGRIKAKQQLEVAGIPIVVDDGILFEDGTEVYNQGLIALNWSSRQDLPMRFWEGLAYRNIVLTQRAIFDLKLVADRFGVRENEHYLGFEDTPELVEKVRWVLDNPDEAARLAARGYAAVWAGQHSYTSRAEQILRDVGF